jgi:hypothetical protein
MQFQKFTMFSMQTNCLKNALSAEKNLLPPVTKMFKVCNGESFTEQCTKHLTLTYILKKKYDPTFSCYADRIFSEFNNILDINTRESVSKLHAPHND